MDIHRRTLLRLTAAAGGIATLPARLFAQPAYPSQPVKLVIPFTAGSTTDVVGRIVGERLQQYLGQPCVVDNRPGAGGTLGASAVVNAAADGHTVLIHSTGHVANAALYPGLKYDTLNDFTPVTMLASMPNVLVVPPDRGFTSLQDLVRKVKAGPQKFVYGSSGSGSASHIAGEKFRIATGIEVAHIPYRGTPQALTDLMGGRLDWFLAPLALAAPLVQGGKLAALAIGAPRWSSGRARSRHAGALRCAPASGRPRTCRPRTGGPHRRSRFRWWSAPAAAAASAVVRRWPVRRACRFAPAGRPAPAVPGTSRAARP